ncbi:hypothetical protein OG320_29665 [Microbispora sp. NBC_01189]|uniref:hypothetical protein n=1 Tax=Microbispora sp. NBC_01189 TaxID=2903583 RepID=UPI002E11E471|nr:hypothetical protein OG320_29665 [Microbispora sp. NBC_01189]
MSDKTVFGTVPSGYAAYARVLHPADSESGEPVTWARVAEVTGRRVHPAARWHTLIDAAGTYDSCSELWPHGGPYDGPEVWWTQSPSLFWPADRAWCVATEIDFDSTFVGGSTAAIGAVLTAPMLEAWPIEGGRSPVSCPGG